MNMLEILNQAAGGRGLQELAAKYGMQPDQAEAVARQVLPAISSGMKRQAQSPDGLQRIARQIHDTDAEEIFTRPGALSEDEPRAQAKGEQILGELFGAQAPEVKSAVAERAAQRAGVDAGSIQSMIPVLASMVLGGMQQRESQGGLGNIVGQLANAQGGGASGGGLGDLLGGLLGGGRQQSGGGLGGLIGGLMGGGQQQQPATGAGQAGADNPLGGLMGMLDADGDGSSADDILDMVMKR